MWERDGETSSAVSPFITSNADTNMPREPVQCNGVVGQSEVVHVYGGGGWRTEDEHGPSVDSD